MRTELVGRRHELALLVDCLDGAIAGRARLVLCRGEPGIGKTRLTEELGALAGSRDVATAWGATAEATGAPPFWPWRQVLRALADSVDLRAVAAASRLEADLGSLAPDLFPDGPGRTEVGPSDVTRFRSFDAVARLLREVTRARPVLVVLDDLHRADPASLLLLRHVVGTMAGQRLLVVATHRDTEPVAPVVTELRLEPVTEVLHLRGLPAPAVGAQLTALLGRSLSDGDVERVHARTGGNPFFVREVARTLGDPRAGAADAPVPDGVRAAIAARLGRLSAGSARALAAASVIGREFAAPTVARVLDVPVLACLTVLDEAAAAGMVEATAVAGRFRFPHDLVHDAVEADLGTSERVRLHRRAAEALEPPLDGTSDGRLADLARHWAVAAVAGERARAAAWIRRAAEEAGHRLAYEEAARLYRLAVTVGAGDLDDGLRCRLLIDAGTALRLAGDLSERPTVSRQAAAIARRLGRADLLAEAAVVLEGGLPDVESEVTLRRWCEEALAGMEPHPSALRARVLATLSDTCMYLGDVDAARAASGQALTAAEASGDPSTLAAAIRARQLVATGPDGVDERSDLAERMAALGSVTRDPRTRMWAHLWRIDVAFQHGDLTAVDREIGPLAQCAEEVRSPVARWHVLQCRAVLAQSRARFADARRLADDALAALPPSATGHGSAVINRTGLLAGVALHTGDEADLTGLRPPGRPGADGGDLDFPTEEVIFSAAAAYLLAVTGRLPEAATVHRRLGPPAGWRPIPHTTTVCFTFGIGTAIALDLRDDVAVLRERLAPFRGQHAVSGAGAIAYDGPVDLYLGMAAGHLGRHDEAIADLESAVRASTANGAAGFAVQAGYELAAVLARRGRTGDRTRARRLAADAAERATALGMRPWADRARDLARRLDGGRADPLTAREREVAALVAEGLTNRQIAGRLHLSERTAQNHVQHILTKLGLANRSQLAVRTVRGTIRADG
ncbi:ATP-binding protein [Geodermatophilus sp. CPCC 205761]|uniref:ATP-binding protein n=1 Tax=Geodermatophilus sp. CPCC 205761 TaxID=2936597 RepID=UPI003EED5AE0